MPATDPDPSELLALAVRAARAAGALLRERFDAGPERQVSAKSSPTDLVSEADLESQRTIQSMIAAARPQDSFLAEEEGADLTGSSGLQWVVDPLDGTINFLFGIPEWCVSIAVTDDHGTVAGVVHDPIAPRMFTAIRGAPAERDGVALSAVGGRGAPLAEALVATGFAYDATVRAAQGEVLARLLPRVRDIRRFGSAALDLAWTAAGRYDVFYERGVNAWDVAAGMLLCECAGLDVRRLKARGELPPGVLVAPRSLASEILGIVG